MFNLIHKAFAASHCPDGKVICNPLKANSFAELIGNIAGLIVTIATPIAVIFIIYSGFLFVSARGNEQQLTKAKETFKWTIIGTALIVGASFLARAITNFAQSL